ncbi:pimeloyl-ACP methyl ester carboxylesterase [Antricoccus suffuscus]|uniref:Pimeloyl-ACP methyl ester carboxylesterase n=1 Tax=Antricoccus suffuscus TaxID=1629062 RepID=A0A2T1A355_9ACTN|nr:alpha/beta hydrolase [Antricoccus suffuscus]PRZ43041.1 pimeloyl-ACP methyl ester carboxylesterase [Antricoccus suffuscus]
MLRRRTIAVNDVELNVIDAGPSDGPLVILAHGFPELGYSWRHQVPALAEAGYRVLAPDQRGYGLSSRPEEIAAYDIEHLSADLIGLIDEIGAEKAVLVGHDWGSMVVWQTTLLHPDRVAGVCGMSVPFSPRPPAPPTQLWRQVFDGQFFYILYFQEPGVADAELDADPAKVMRRLLSGTRTDVGTSIEANADDGRGFVERAPEPAHLPAWLSQEELDVYVAEFTRTGFTGGLNWYRNFDRNWELTPQLDGATIDVPSLFIGGKLDPVLLMAPPDAQAQWLTDFRGNQLIEDAGHWVQQEKANEVNTALLNWLRDITKEH